MWFQKGSQHKTCTFQITPILQKELDNGGFVGTILMDLSKAYDCIPHELLMAKLKCYGIDNGSLQLLLDHLNNRKKGQK